MQHELKADKLQCIEHKVIGTRTVCVRYRRREKALEAMNADSSINQLKAVKALSGMMCPGLKLIFSNDDVSRLFSLKFLVVV